MFEMQVWQGPSSAQTLLLGRMAGSFSRQPGPAVPQALLSIGHSATALLASLQLCITLDWSTSGPLHLLVPLPGLFILQALHAPPCPSSGLPGPPHPVRLLTPPFYPTSCWHLRRMLHIRCSVDGLPVNCPLATVT
jgi:hypothetical protein